MAPFGWIKQAVRPLRRAERGSRHRASPRVLENLEGRTLLSGFQSMSPRAAILQQIRNERASMAAEARQSMPRFTPRQPSWLFHGPLNQRIVGGHVTKQPRFYSGYQGPIRPELNGTGAMGQLIPGVGYIFTGRVQGPIDSSQPAEYIFGVNRGGATGATTIAAPFSGIVSYSGGKSMIEFPRRPMIFVDALVTISVGPEGNTGNVLLMGQEPGQEVAIQPEDIKVEGQELRVRIDPALLPPNGIPANMASSGVPANSYSYVFWTRDPSIEGPGGVASFVPEYNITPMGAFPHG